MEVGGGGKGEYDPFPSRLLFYFLAIAYCTFKQCCGSGSGTFAFSEPEPECMDPDPKFKWNDKVLKKIL